MELKTKMFVWNCFLCAILLFAFMGESLGDELPFDMGTIGCPMAHCDAQMTDNPGLPAPSAPAYHNHVDETFAANVGLGCASNGSLAACAFKMWPDAVRVYDRDGRVLWSSGMKPNKNTYTSAPIIDKNNQVIVADNVRIMRFDLNNNGRVVWEAPMVGYPISPVPDGHGFLLVGTKKGPVSTYNPDGIQTAVDSKWVCFDSQRGIFLSDVEPDGDYYEVDNTPTFNRDGDRAYITMANVNKDKQQQGALVALNVVNGQLSLAWWYPFTSPSGASPLVVEDVGPDQKTVVYFDGRYDVNGVVVAEIFAVEDQGEAPAELWRKKLTPPTSTAPIWWIGQKQKTIDASFTADPDDGCMWYYANTWYEVMFHDYSDGNLRCLDYENGREKIKVDPGCLFGDCGSYSSSGLLSFSHDRQGGPVLLVNAVGAIGTVDPSHPYQRKNKIAAIRPVPGCNTSSLIWEEDLPVNGSIQIDNNTSGQFAFFSADPQDPNSPTRIIFSTNSNGVHVIGDNF